MKRLMATIVWILFWLVGAFAAPAHAGESTPGRLGAHFSVKQGMASYRIPITTPPGIDKMQPSLSLTYASGSGLQLSGVGWRLSGLPGISRTGAIIAIDGFSGGVAYGPNDRFAYGSQELIAVEGAYGAPGTQYQTQITTRSSIVSQGTCGSGPCSFTIKTASGKTMTFGASENSRITAVDGESVRIWALDQITDLNGNSMTVAYTQDPLGTGKASGHAYPTEIAYTANTAAGMAANRFVRFAYGPRAYPITAYEGGSPLHAEALLTHAQTYLGGDLVFDYQLEYTTSPSTGRDLLAGLTVCGSSGCIEPLAFDYSKMALAFEKAKTWYSGDFTAGQGWTLDKQPVTLADVNGDGMADIVGFRQGTQVALSNGASFDQAKPWIGNFSTDQGWTDQDDDPRFVVDVNADGMADILGFNQQGTVVAVSTGTGFQLRKTFSAFGGDQGWGAQSDNPRMVADVNGDKILDIVGFKGVTWVALGVEGGFETPRPWSLDFGSQKGWQDKIRTLADVNGDGMADVVGFGADSIEVALSTGRAFSSKGWSKTPFPHFTDGQGWNTGQNQRMMADVNGDGLMDIVGFSGGTQSATGALAALSNGKGFERPAPWSANFGNPGWTNKWNYRTLADVNGDALADAVGFGDDKVHVGLSNTASFVGGQWQSMTGFCQNQGWQVDVNARFVVDVNGDGMADIVGFGAENVSVSLASGPMPDLLTGAVNGIGGGHRIDYAPLSDATIYTNDEGAAGYLHSGVTRFYDQDLPTYPNATLGGASSYVVSGYTAQNDPNVNSAAYSYTYSYSYADAQINLEGRGWQGFRTVTLLNRQTGRETVTSYNQDFPLTGTMARRQRQCGPASPDPNCTPGAIQEIVRNAYLTKVVASGSSAPNPPIYFTHRQGRTQDFYDYGVYNLSLGTRFSYDADGNRNVTAKLNRVDQQGNDLDPGDNVYELVSYQDDATKHLFGFPRYWKTSKTSSLGGIKSFDPKNDFQLTRYGYDARMNRTSQAKWDDAPDVKGWVGSTYGYDAYGNQTQITDPAGVTTTIDIETTYRTYPETSRTPPNGAGKTLTTRYAYDARFGLLAGTVSPSGEAFARCYDAFGRPSVAQGPLPETPKGNGGETPCLDAGFVTNVSAFSAKRFITLANYAYRKDAGSVLVETQTLQSWPTPAAPGATRWQKEFLDGLARVVQVEKQSDCGSTDASILADRAYNDASRLTSVSLPYYAGDPTFHQTYGYDSYGRLTQTAKPAGDAGTRTSLTTLAYAGSATGGSVVVTQAAGQDDAYVRNFAYGFANNKRRTTSMIAPGDRNAVTRYGYDLLGRPTSATSPATTSNPNGLTNRLRYDSLGRKFLVVDATRGKIVYRYNAGGQLAFREDANGKTTYGYDGLGRLGSVTRPDNTNVAFSYDQNGDLGRLTGATLVNSAAGLNASHAFGYDAYGRRGSVALSLAGHGDYQSRYGYDPTGRLVAYAAPNGQLAEWGYNACRLDRVSLDGKDYAVYQDFTAAGLPRRIAYGNGVETRLAYAPTGEPIGQATLNAENALLSAQSLSWNLLGQVVALSELSPAEPMALGSSPLPARLDDAQPGVDTLTYRYESLRLTGVASANNAYPAQSFSYDPAGNLTSKNGISYQLDGYKAVSGSGAAGSFQASYDAMGNMTALSISPTQGESVDWTYQYDAVNKLTEASKNGQTVQINRYDFLGRRLVREDAQGAITVYVDKLYQERRDGEGAVQTLRLETPYGLVATVDSKAAGPAARGAIADTRYFSQNHLRSTTMTTDATGKLTARLHYLPYGELWAASGDDGFQVKFTGKTLDAATGLYDYGARFYHPGLGRFVTADNRLGASRFRQDAYNRYEYALGNPILYRDPTGHAAKENIQCAGAVMGGGAAVSIGGLVISSNQGKSGVKTGVAEGSIAMIGGVGGGLAGCSDVISSGYKRLKKRFGRDHAPGDNGSPLAETEMEDLSSARSFSDRDEGSPPRPEEEEPSPQDPEEADSFNEGEPETGSETNSAVSQGEDDGVSGDSALSSSVDGAEDGGEAIAEESESFWQEALGFLEWLGKKILGMFIKDAAEEVAEAPLEALAM